MAAEMFKDKMAILNSNFLQFVQQAIQAHPAADLTPTVQDYVNHVQKLDSLYGGLGTSTSTVTNIPINVEKETWKKDLSPLSSRQTPPTTQPSLETQHKPILFEKKTPEFNIEKKTEEKKEPRKSDLNGSRSLSRKRKEIGGDEDYDKVRASMKISDPIASLPSSSSFAEAAAAFKASQQAREPEKTTSSFSESTPAITFAKPPSTTPLPSFPSFKTSTPITQSDNKTNPTPVSNFRFSTLPQQQPSEITGNKPKISFNFGEPPSKEDQEKTMLNIPTFQLMPISSFQPTTSQNDSEDKKPISSLSDKELKDELTQYGFSTGPITPSTRKVYEKKLDSFRKSPPKIQQTKADEKDNNEPQEIIPQIVEVVEHNEPDAIYSAKCVLFSFTAGEYKKVGVGFLHVKKLDKNFQLLLRAANTLGTIWINTLINDQLNAQKVKDTQLRISYPTESEVKTNLLRFGKAEEVSKILDYINKK